jgi:ABC-type uncharacterized transport system ATPase subunit
MAVLIDIYHDISFVSKLQDEVLPAISIMAFGRFLCEEEIDPLLQCDDENLSELDRKSVV